MACPNAILVVDDEPTVRKFLCRILRAAGYDVHDAENAEDALAVLRRMCIAVMLVDWRMPGRGGDWLIDEANKQFRETAVVLATGEYVSPYSDTQQRIAGYLSKPFTVDAVQAAVADAVAWHEVMSRTKK